MSLAIPNGLDNTSEGPGERAPLVLGDTTYHDITEAVCQVAERKPSKAWVIGFLISFGLLFYGAYGTIKLARQSAKLRRESLAYYGNGNNSVSDKK